MRMILSFDSCSLALLIFTTLFVVAPLMNFGPPSVQASPMLDIFVRKAFAQIRLRFDQELKSLFPELSDQIDALHNNVDKLVQCYEDTISTKEGEERISIFENNVFNITKKFLDSRISQLNNGVDLRKRAFIFVTNIRRLAKLIITCVNSNSTINNRYGITSMAFFSQEEIKSQILNKKFLGFAKLQAEQTLDKTKCSLNIGKGKPIPEAFDWRSYNKVSPVLNQKSCMSCYLFSTVHALESQYMIVHNTTGVSLSVQAVLNCMRRPEYESSDGCNGGLFPDPLKHFITNGVPLRKDFPYLAHQEKCVKYTPFVKADLACYNENVSEEQLQRLVLHQGPVAVAIDGDSIQLQLLKNQKFDNPVCTSSVSHAVLLVGWDKNYWIIKNSWADDWGMKGYLYLPRKPANLCGVLSMAGQTLINRK